MSTLKSFVLLMIPLLSLLISGAQLDAKTKEIEWNPEKNFPKDEKESDGMV